MSEPLPPLPLILTGERNGEGAFLVNPTEFVKEIVGEGFSRRSGGWIKRIDRLDKTKTDGYSLVGPFLEDRIQWVKPGLLLDCSISGSRNRPSKGYTLLALYPNGQVEWLADQEGADWAVKLWPWVEEGYHRLATAHAALLAPAMAHLHTLSTEAQRLFEGMVIEALIHWRSGDGPALEGQLEAIEAFLIEKEIIMRAEEVPYG